MGLLDSAAGQVTQARNFISNPFSQNVNGSTLRGPDFPQGLKIIEIVNGIEQTSDQVVLIGSMMPKDKLSFGGKQRLKKEYYAGNSEPVVHVLGPEESDLEIKGRFYDKRLKPVDKFAGGVAYDVSRMLDAIRIRGNLVRIDLDGEYRRYGFLEETVFELKNVRDVEYTLRFSLVGFNPPKNTLFLQGSELAPFEVNKDLVAQATAYQASYSTVPQNMPLSIGDLLGKGISAVAGVMSTVTGFVDSLVATAEDVNKQVHRALGLITYAQNTLRDFKRRIGVITHDKTLYGMGSMTTTDRYVASAFLVSAVRDANNMVQTLALMKAQFEALALSVPLLRYRVLPSDTLQSISNKNYGNADHWKDIYDHNKLTTTALTVGTVLEIPRIS